MSTDAQPSFDPKNMKFKQLGRNGIKASGTQKGSIVKDLIKCAYDHGCNTFDTAEVYAMGQSEIEMGQAFKDLGLKREELVITTKVYFGTGRKDPNQRGLSRKHIVEGTKASLQRLGLSYVDIILAHRPDASVPMEEIVRAFNFVIDQGWAFYWGFSEASAAELQEAWAVADRLGLVGPSAEQPQYNAFHRQKVDGDFLPLFKDRGMGTTIWSPLASGLLTGKYNDGIPKGSRFDNHSDFFKSTVESLQSGEGKAKIEKVKKLTTIAEKLGTSVGNLSLAWCAKNDNVSTVILGATSVQQLEENFKAIDVIDKLTPEVMQQIEEILQNKPSA